MFLKSGAKLAGLHETGIIKKVQNIMKSVQSQVRPFSASLRICWGVLPKCCLQKVVR